MKTYPKLLSPLLFTIFTLCFNNLALADGFTIELLDPNLTYQEESLLATSSFPLRSGQRNSKKDFYNDNRGALFIKNKGISYDCLLRNSERWQVAFIYGLNEQGDLMAVLEHSDYQYKPNETSETYSQFHRTAILRRTGKKVEDYCPRVAYSVNKECRKELQKFPNEQFNFDSTDLKHTSISFPITTNRNINWSALPNTLNAIENDVNCKIKLIIKDSSGRTIPSSNFATSITHGSLTTDIKTDVLKVGKTKNGRIEVNIKLLNLLSDYFPTTAQDFGYGPCPVSEFKLQSPYASDKWISKGFSFRFYDTCQ